ncbi:hypothetical protein [Mariprofundus ferrooxydans]|uniref:hypothetical protein n=1 Tax=Mariprofundus ferrooxydans TaxID=314344 RepID=UPI00037FFA49|nr:hypothetical protein [Mariprofundus ferrooxydans]
MYKKLYTALAVLVMGMTMSGCVEFYDPFDYGYQRSHQHSDRGDDRSYRSDSGDREHHHDD